MKFYSDKHVYIADVVKISSQKYRIFSNLNHTLFTVSEG